MSYKLQKVSAEIAGLFPNGNEFLFYADSCQKAENLNAVMARDNQSRFLLLSSKENAGAFAAFDGEVVSGNGIYAKKAMLTEKNAAALRKVFPWTAPVPVLNKKCSFGCGDRLGLATSAHAELFKKYNAFPVFAQQSIRELNLTKRTYRSVIDDASFQVFQAGYTGGFGADGDHLKSFEHIDMALDVGVTMLTLDLSDELHPAFADVSGAELEKAYAACPADVRSVCEKTEPRFFENIHCRSLRRKTRPTEIPLPRRLWNTGFSGHGDRRQRRYRRFLRAESFCLHPPRQESLHLVGQM